MEEESCFPINQEAVWIDEQQDETTTTETASVGVAPTKTKSRLFRRVFRKPPTPNTNRRPKQTTTTTTATRARVVLLPPETPRHVARRKKAVKKAKHARKLLDKALLQNQNGSAAAVGNHRGNSKKKKSTTTTTTDDDNKKKQSLLSTAFQMAAEARRLMERNPEDVEPELRETRSRGEAAGQEAQRMLRTAATANTDKEDKEEGENGKKRTTTTRQRHAQQTTKDLILAAKRNSEEAKRYLESMLPKLLDVVVEDSGSEFGNDTDIVSFEASSGGGSISALSTSSSSAASASSSSSSSSSDDQEDESTVDDVQRKLEERYRKRQRQKQQAQIEEVVVRNATISTLGFDNTYHEGMYSPRNNNNNTPRVNPDDISVSSLNELLDGPEAAGGGVGSNKKMSDNDNLVRDMRVESSSGEDALHEKKRKRRGVLGRFYRRRRDRLAAEEAQQQQEQQQDRTFQKYIAKLAKEEEGENDKEPVPPEADELARVQTLESLTEARLQKALETDGSLSSFDGVPMHYAPATNNAAAAASSPTKGKKNPKTEFVNAPAVDPSHLLGQNSWGSAVSVDSDGPRPQGARYANLGVGEDEDAAAAAAALVLVEEEGDFGVPNDLPRLRSDDSDVGFGDRYTSATDDNDSVILRARRRLQDSEPFVPALDIMDTNPQPIAIRAVASMGTRRGVGSELGLPADETLFAPLEVSAEPGEEEEEAATASNNRKKNKKQEKVLVNRVAMVQAMTTPRSSLANNTRQADQGMGTRELKRTLSHKDVCIVKPSPSFENEINETKKEKIMERESGNETESSSQEGDNEPTLTRTTRTTTTRNKNSNTRRKNRLSIVFRKLWRRKSDQDKTTTTTGSNNSIYTSDEELHDQRPQTPSAQKSQSTAGQSDEDPAFPDSFEIRDVTDGDVEVSLTRTYSSM